MQRNIKLEKCARSLIWLGVATFVISLLLLKATYAGILLFDR